MADLLKQILSVTAMEVPWITCFKLICVFGASELVPCQIPSTSHLGPCEEKERANAGWVRQRLSVVHVDPFLKFLKPILKAQLVKLSFFGTGVPRCSPKWECSLRWPHFPEAWSCGLRASAKKRLCRPSRWTPRSGEDQAGFGFARVWDS